MRPSTMLDQVFVKENNITDVLEGNSWIFISSLELYATNFVFF